MVRVAVLGATGYSALELFKILLRHPDVEITVATSRQEGNLALSAVHPSLAGRTDLRLEDPQIETLTSRADCIFSCLPHGVVTVMVPPLLAAGKKVIDLSADYRLRDPKAYAHWYNQEHGDPERLAIAVYGLPELFREAIPQARLIANPGCYPTSAILALAPLLKRGVIESSGIIVDSKSGISGAGRTPKLTTLYPECNESFSAYNVGRHRHTPEINQILSTASASDVRVIFTPHLVPMDRGILSTAYSVPKAPVTDEKVLDVLRTFYRDEPFVRVVDHLPATKDSAYTNFCDITARVVDGRVITISCIDNLIKGASGAAVQNFNLMYGFSETTALP
jgi:N-acetyl-gamma-glutamyl-phosphate reductase